MAPQMPNLYNQSLAAREQARSLLQASENMRSLSNLLHPNQTNIKNKTHDHRHLNINNNNGCNSNSNTNGSHLNLPLSFSFDRQPQQLDVNHLLTSNVNSTTNNLWHHNNAHHMRQTSNSEGYQLVSCSSISPSSATSGTNSNQGGPCGNQDNRQQLLANHYSTIEQDDDDAPRYEELEGQRNQPKRASTSSFKSDRLNSASTDFRTIHGGTESTSLINNGDSTEKQQNKPPTKQKLSSANKSSTSSNQYPDQLSPYAVSSICNTNNGNNNPPLPPPPPAPVASEAIRQALNEKFDINQLMLLDETGRESHLSLPFEPPPPPPTSIPPQKSGHSAELRRAPFDRSHSKRKSGGQKQPQQKNN